MHGHGSTDAEFPIILSHNDDDLDHGPVGMRTRSHAKQVQSALLHNSSASQHATVDTVGVVPAYSSEIPDVNSKDLVLQLPKNLTDIMLTLSDVNSIKQP